MPTETDLDRFRVVLVASRNPLNIGAAARAMSNFGFLHLRVVNPYEIAFREARSAVGASELLARAEEYETVAEAVADCVLVIGTSAAQHRELRQPLLRLNEASSTIRGQAGSGPIALVFGSEKVGLSNEALSYCHYLMRIPTRDEHSSMNLGQAVAVCLYELTRDTPSKVQTHNSQCSTSADLERLTSNLVECLRLSGYLHSQSHPLSEEKVRRLLRRLGLQTDDTALLTGMLRQILWKLRSGD